MNNFNETEIKKTLLMMKDVGSIFEIRVIFSTKEAHSGYFNNADTMLKELKKFDNSRPKNVYITLNSINECCFDREQKNKFIKSASNTADNDMVGYEWVMIDIDPIRPKGISSTDSQVEYSKKKGNEVYLFLKNQGFEKPIFAFSGNGVHLLYKVKFANNDENKNLVKSFLEYLSILFSDDVVKIDTVNFNQSRVCKLYGTLAMKGTNSEERPYRMSYILQSETEIAINDKSFIEKVANMMPKEEKPTRYNNYSPAEFDLDNWLSKNYIRYKTASHADGTKYILEECPFDSSHNGKDAVLFKGRNGAIGFHCFHDSCSGRTWQDMRLKFEPDAYDYKHQQPYRQPNYTNPNFKVEIVEEIKEVDGKPIFLTTENIRLMATPEEEYIPSGINVIDKKLGGLKKTYVSVLSGLRAGGKSSVISQMVLECAEKDYRVALFSGELTPKNLMKWMYLQCAGKNHVKPTIYENKFFVPDKEIKKMSKWLNEKLYVYNNEYGNNFEQIMIQLKKCVVDYKVDFIILDNLMALNIPNSNNDKYAAQSKFVQDLEDFAKACNIHILFVAHPRKSQGFLRLDDISGSNDITNRVDNAFIIHRMNKDFRDNYKMKFNSDAEIDFPRATNVIEICKDRDFGTQDLMIPLYFEPETKRLKNEISEYKRYGWETNDGFCEVTAAEQFEIEECIFN
jgi:archaellum biogenesis ATPase FlaH